MAYRNPVNSTPAKATPAIDPSDGARKRILDLIRRAQGRGASASPADHEAIDTYLRAHPRGPLPNIAGDLIGHFRSRAQASQSTTDIVERESDLPAAVARYLDSLNLPRSGCVWPALERIDWASSGLALEPRGATDNDAIGVTGSFAALAETGTLMVVSGPRTPATVSLLPETHIAVVAASRIVAIWRMPGRWRVANWGNCRAP